MNSDDIIEDFRDGLESERFEEDRILECLDNLNSFTQNASMGDINWAIDVIGRHIRMNTTGSLQDRLWTDVTTIGLRAAIKQKSSKKVDDTLRWHQPNHVIGIESTIKRGHLGIFRRLLEYGISRHLEMAIEEYLNLAIEHEREEIMELIVERFGNTEKIDFNRYWLQAIQDGRKIFALYILHHTTGYLDYGTAISRLLQAGKLPYVPRFLRGMMGANRKGQSDALSSLRQTNFIPDLRLGLRYVNLLDATDLTCLQLMLQFPILEKNALLHLLWEVYQWEELMDLVIHLGTPSAEITELIPWVDRRHLYPISKIE